MTTGWILYRKRQAELSDRDHAILRFLAAARAQKIELKVYTPEQFSLLVTEVAPQLLLEGKTVELPDFVLPRMGSFTSYQGLAVIRHLEVLGVPSYNSASTIETVKDKWRVHQILSAHQLPMPKTELLSFPYDLTSIQTHFSGPLVVKNVVGTEGIGICLCETLPMLKDTLDLIYSHNMTANILLQEFIETSRGRDLRVFVLGGRVIACMQRSSTSSFKANVSQGAQVSAFSLTPEIETLALKVAQILNLEIAGIDLLFGKEGYLVCEANSSPWFKGLEEVVGAVIAEQILEYIMSQIKS